MVDIGPEAQDRSTFAQAAESGISESLSHTGEQHRRMYQPMGGGIYETYFMRCAASNIVEFRSNLFGMLRCFPCHAQTGIPSGGQGPKSQSVWVRGEIMSIAAWPWRCPFESANNRESVAFVSCRIASACFHTKRITSHRRPRDQHQIALHRIVDLSCEQ